MTWPQARQLVIARDAAPGRVLQHVALRWFAHALVTPPAHLFDGNIFYPEPRTLTFLGRHAGRGAHRGAAALGRLPPVLVHNLMLLGGIAASGVGDVRARAALTGSRGAGLIAGIVFAFAPYRFEHFMHMELQWTVWMPLAFLALHRTLRHAAAGDTARHRRVHRAADAVEHLLRHLPRDAARPRRAAAGAPRSRRPASVARFCRSRRARRWPRDHRRVCDSVYTGRVQWAIVRWGKSRSSAPARGLPRRDAGTGSTGPRSGRGNPERRLFPGWIPVLLAIVGFAAALLPSRPRQIAYCILLVVAFETSLGFHGDTIRFSTIICRCTAACARRRASACAC